MKNKNVYKQKIMKVYIDGVENDPPLPKLEEIKLN